jgi:hypothetical protein
MNMVHNPTRTLTEIALDTRRRFKEEFGRLLTEEEAVRLTDEIREEIRRENESDEN